MTVAHLIDLIPTKNADERRQMRENALRLLERGGQKAADAKALLEALDAAEAQEREARVRRVADLDNVQRIIEAFRQMPMAEHERLVSQILMDNPGMPSESLSRACGWNGKAWHLHFGSMCRDREHLLWPAKFDAGLGKDFYGGILGDFDARGNGYTLKPEAVEAFKALGLVLTRRR